MSNSASRNGDASFVFHDLDFGAVADDRIAVFDSGNAPDIHTHRRIELQRASASRRLRAAEHHANLVPNLVDENQTGLSIWRRSRYFAVPATSGAACRPMWESPISPSSSRLRRQGSQGINYQDVNRAGAQPGQQVISSACSP